MLDLQQGYSTRRSAVMDPTTAAPFLGLHNEIVALRSQIGVQRLQTSHLRARLERVQEVIRFWEPRTKDLQARMMYQQLLAAMDGGH